MAAWSAGRGEFRVAFDQPLDPQQLKSLARNVAIEAGRSVAAGDRFETIRPGYEVVKRQVSDSREKVAVLSASLSSDGRTLIVNTPPNETSWNYAVTILGLGGTPTGGKGVAMQSAVDLQTSLNGVQARWTNAAGEAIWDGWLPHVDLAVARALTRGSAEHERLFALLGTPGQLRMRGQLDLSPTTRGRRAIQTL